MIRHFLLAGWETDKTGHTLVLEHRAGLPHICAHHPPWLQSVKKTKECQACIHMRILSMCRQPTCYVTHWILFSEPLKTIPFLFLKETLIDCYCIKQQAPSGHSQGMQCGACSLKLHCERTAQVGAAHKPPHYHLLELWGHLLSSSV